METPNEKIKMFFHLIFQEIEKIYRNIFNIFFNIFSFIVLGKIGREKILQIEIFPEYNLRRYLHKMAL